MYAENYKTMMEEVKEDLNKWGDRLYSTLQDSIFL